MPSAATASSRCRSQWTTGATGHGVGVIGSLDFYLDDIAPDTLGRPIFPHGFGIAPGI
jgi:hypothetical protein